MTNLTVIMIYSPILLMTVIALMGSYQAQRKQATNRSLLFLVSMLFGWQVFEVLYFTTESQELARLCVDFKLPFIAFCSVGLLFFSVQLYHLDSHVTKLMYMAICLVPLITSILALTSPFHSLIRQELIVLTDGPVHQQINVRGPWFWVHTVYSNIIILINFITVWYQHQKLPKEHRFPSTIIMTGLTISLICSTATISGVWKYPVNLTLIGSSVAIIIIYVAVMRHDQMDILMLARKEIFNFLEECVFVLDSQNRIIEKNMAARIWMGHLGLEPDAIYLTLEDVLEHLRAIGASFKKGLEDDDGFDIELWAEEKFIYNARMKVIHNKAGQVIGTFVTCMDVTANRQLINNLEYRAGFDALTGLPNRWSFDTAMQDMDCAENLPLAILLGDLNNLKQINDRMGHKYGDEVLRETAERLSDTCPGQGRLFRIGGDEFVMLLPKYDKDRMASLVEQIDKQMTEIKGFEPAPSIALGYSVKENMQQNLAQLLGVADENMYLHKYKRHA